MNSLNRKHYKLLALVLLVLGLSMVFWRQTTMAGDYTEENWGIADAKEEEIYSKVPGRVTQIYVNEGDLVHQGQLLARIDQDSQKTERTQAEASLQMQYAQLQQTVINSNMERNTLMASLRVAEAQAAQAKSALNLSARDEVRYRQLLAKNAVSQQQYDSAKAGLEAAQAAYEAAQANVESARSGLAKNAANQEAIEAQKKQMENIQGKIDAISLSEKETEIRAAFDGTITKKYIEKGSLIGSTVPLFSLQDTNDNWVIFKVKETELQHYHIGDAIRMTGRNENLKVDGKIESISHKAYYATIKATNERGDKDIVTFDVKVRTNSPDIWPGMRFKLER